MTDCASNHLESKTEPEALDLSLLEALFTEAVSPSNAYEVSWRARPEGVCLSTPGGIRPEIWFPRSPFADSAIYYS